MKTNFLISWVLIVGLLSGYSDEARSLENDPPIDIEKYMAGSDLSPKLSEIGKNIKTTDIDKVIEILQTNYHNMFGGLEHQWKFQNLMSYYGIVEKHPENKKIIPHLMKVYKNLEPVKSKENMNWGEMGIYSAGGSLGRTIRILAIIGERDAIVEMVDHAIKNKKIEKLKEIVTRLKEENYALNFQYKDAIKDRIGKENPESVNSILKKALEELKALEETNTAEDSK